MRSSKRYPGIRPFQTDESDRFFGRDADIERLWRLVRLEQVVILYGKSGYGKSSLLAAGIYPRLAADARYQHWEIRFGPYRPGESRTPAEAACSQIVHTSGGQELFPGAESGATLWQALKNRQTADSRRFILFFDQFEEIFTYPPDQILAFRQQLAEALYTAVPENIAAATLTESQEAALNQPFELKVVFAIRADRMSQLNALQDYLPNLLRHGYLLEALDEMQAVAAIVEPARIQSAVSSLQSTASNEQPFATPPFSYSPEAIQAILHTLRDEQTGRFETSALQIVCRHVEDNIIGPTGKRDVGVADLGDLSTIFADFYANTLSSLAPDEQTAARHLCEDVLIKDGARVPYAAAALLGQPGISQSLLERLTAASLLRVERDEQGRMLYEIGHDTLVAPVARAAEQRRAEEAEAERKREEVEKRLALEREAARQEAERRKIARARRRNVTGAVVALVLISLSFFSLLQANRAAARAKENEVAAHAAKASADSMQFVVARQTDVVKASQDTLERTRGQVLAAEADLERARQDVIASQNATEAQKRIAADNLLKAEHALWQARRAADEAADALLANAADAIFNLRYAQAREKLLSAARLRARTDQVARLLTEVAFFYTETNNLDTARSLIDTIAVLQERDLTAGASSRELLRHRLDEFDVQRYQALRRLYYPLDQATIPAGKFSMGCDVDEDSDCANDEKPIHTVYLDSFLLARTEITMYQFTLYCIAKGLAISDFHEASWGPPRGLDPVIKVSWYSAVNYANWASEQLGYEPVYQIDSMRQDTSNKSDYDDLKWIVKINKLANGFRLPTEAEWEYAARGGQTFVYAGSNEISQVATFEGRTDLVAQKKKNHYDLYDMSGNVAEWCWDWYGPYTAELMANPTGFPQGISRVLRGGSWYYDYLLCRVRFRSGFYADVRNYSFGFRLAQSL